MGNEQTYEQRAEAMILALWHGPGFSSLGHGPRSKWGKQARKIIADHIRAAVEETQK